MVGKLSNFLARVYLPDNPPGTIVFFLRKLRGIDFALPKLASKNCEGVGNVHFLSRKESHACKSRDETSKGFESLASQEE